MTYHSETSTKKLDYTQSKSSIPKTDHHKPKLYELYCLISCVMDHVPKLVYDDDCRFCTWSATFVVRRSDIQPVRLSEVQEEQSRLSDLERDRLPDDYEECAQLITENAVYSCGAATEESLVIAGVLPRRLIEFLRRFKTYSWLREKVYHTLSNNRDLVSNVFSREPPVSDHVSEEDVYPEEASR